MHVSSEAKSHQTILTCNVGLETAGLQVDGLNDSKTKKQQNV